MKNHFLSENREKTPDIDSDMIRNEESGEENEWKILIVDDKYYIHKLMRTFLRDLSFEGHKLKFLSAYSAEEAKEIIMQNPDTALIFLDVVMETKDAGFQVVRYVRDELQNKFVRIILQTGHPEDAPEHEVMNNFDINDYRTKNELINHRLYTTVTSALRGYRDIRKVDENRKGLERIINASTSLFSIHSPKQIAVQILHQLSAVLKLNTEDQNAITSGFVAVQDDHEYIILAAYGKFQQELNRPLVDFLPESVISNIEGGENIADNFFYGNHYVGYSAIRDGKRNIICLKAKKPFSNTDQKLLEIFSTNFAIAFDNIHLKREIVCIQKELLFTLGEVVEARSKETANHVQRVADFAHLMALKLGFGEEEARLIRLASPMHDVGKMGIPDSILNKPGALTMEEYEIMKEHTIIGYNILKNSNRKILQAASTICLQHHEKWNGRGYPGGMKGEEIHIYGRITGLSDVVDALSHRRVYKEAWTWEEVADYVKTQRGEHFDPQMADIFLANLDEFHATQKEYPDQEERPNRAFSKKSA